MSKYFYCSKVADYFMEYEVTTFTSGDKLVFCSVSGARDQTTGTSWLRPTAQGNPSAACNLVFDIDTATSGYWEFRADGSRRATYRDINSANANIMVTFETSNCYEY